MLFRNAGSTPAISTIFAIGAKMVNEAERLHFTLFAPCRFAAIAKALHSKAGGFSSHLHRSPGEALLVRTLPSVVCSSRHSAAGATADEVAHSAHLLVRRSLRRRRMKSSRSANIVGVKSPTRRQPHPARDAGANFPTFTKIALFFRCFFVFRAVYYSGVVCLFPFRGIRTNRKNVVQTMKFILKQCDIKFKPQ